MTVVFQIFAKSMAPRETLRILDKLKLDKTMSDKVFYRNLEAVTGKKP